MQEYINNSYIKLINYYFENLIELHRFGNVKEEFFKKIQEMIEKLKYSTPLFSFADFESLYQYILPTNNYSREKYYELIKFKEKYLTQLPEKFSWLEYVPMLRHLLKLILIENQMMNSRIKIQSKQEFYNINDNGNNTKTITKRISANVIYRKILSEPDKDYRILLWKRLTGKWKNIDKQLIAILNSYNNYTNNLGFNGLYQLLQLLSPINLEDYINELENYLNKTKKKFNKMTKEIVNYFLPELSNNETFNIAELLPLWDLIKYNKNNNIKKNSLYDTCLIKEAFLEIFNEFDLYLDKSKLVWDIALRQNKSNKAFLAYKLLDQKNKFYIIVNRHADLPGLRSVFHELGHALHFLNISDNIPLIQRYLGPKEIMETAAMVMDRLFLEPKFIETLFPTEDKMYIRLMKWQTEYMFRRNSVNLLTQIESFKLKNAQKYEIEYNKNDLIDWKQRNYELVIKYLNIEREPYDTLNFLKNGIREHLGITLSHIATEQIKELLDNKYSNKDSLWWNNPNVGKFLKENFYQYGFSKPLTLLQDKLGVDFFKIPYNFI